MRNGSQIADDAEDNKCCAGDIQARGFCAGRARRAGSDIADGQPHDQNGAEREQRADGGICRPCTAEIQPEQTQAQMRYAAAGTQIPGQRPKQAGDPDMEDGADEGIKSTRQKQQPE